MNGIRGECSRTDTAPASGAGTSAPPTSTSTSCGGSASGLLRLGEIAAIRFGVKTGCDAFFMPKDITADVLARHTSDRDFRQHAGGAPRKDVESGKLRIIKAGDGSVHPVEAKYLAPELHSIEEDGSDNCSGRRLWTALSYW